MSAIKIVIIHDDVFVRQGFDTLVTRAYPDARISFLAGDSPVSTFSGIQADLLVCYHTAGESSALRVLASMQPILSSPPVLVVSTFPEAEAAPLCIAAGACGLLANSAPPADFLIAMDRLLNGGTYFSAIAAKAAFAARKEMQEAVPDFVGKLLSRREIEVFSGFGEGLPARAIALRMGISVKTVEAHREHIKNKLNFHTASEVVIAASRWLRAHN